jgi:2-phosphosulfolactate phosphatase
MVKEIFDQSKFDVRCEWGERGVRLLSPISDVVIIVDVISFSSCVEIATNRSAIIFPYSTRDESAWTYAKSVQAQLAVGRGNHGYSLSPQSMMKIPKGTRLVVCSPNGASLSLSTGNTTTLCGCLRNASAIAQVAQNYGRKISVIPAGEKWDDGTLRPSFEDLVGAGAILAHLTGSQSPDVAAAIAAFRGVQSNLSELLMSCVSGRELIERGYEEDIRLASELECSSCVPILADGAYTKFQFDK